MRDEAEGREKGVSASKARCNAAPARGYTALPHCEP